MKRTSLALACALAWACALPASAQMAPATSPAATADGKAMGKEKARLAKAQNADCREKMKARQEKQKKASAT